MFAEPLQHALIHEPDNVADSEDSEDEWNYYRIDPNKEKDSVTPVDEPQETKNVEEETDVPELAVEDIESKIQSEGIEEDIKCESPKEESPKLFNTEVFFNLNRTFFISTIRVYLPLPLSIIIRYLFIYDALAS